MKRLCVFCGSSPGNKPEYKDAAELLGTTMVNRGIGLVYGGGNVGMMLHVARAVLNGNGEVIGVMPKDIFDKGVALTELADLRIVGSMHERKALMGSLSDGFIALPGGMGTMEEFFEALTWAQLDIHSKPCGLLDVLGYFDGILAFLDRAVEDGFLEPGHREMIVVDSSPEKLLDRFETYKPPTVDKAAWVRKLKQMSARKD